ncbi:hypothetical protein [Marinobacter sp. V034]|uniref:hypothetical protein n=1 Tax=Marinobacter sp. V034 TaxID=3459610 RepID=UPI0040441B23
MQFSYSLDRDGGLDPLDPLGNLFFSSASGAVVSIGDTYLDAWLYELLVGVNELVINGTTIISIAEDENILAMTLKRKNLILNWHGEEIVGCADEFFRSLTTEANRLVKELKSMPGFEKNPAVNEIEKLLENSSLRK